MSSTPTVATRTLAWWCPDWPVVAAGIRPDEPAAVVAANRVLATTPAARREGVAEGQRRREAQGRCPGLVVIAPDESRDNRMFEPVAVALESLAPRMEITRPGVVAFPTRGPSRHHGGDASLAQLALDRTEGALEELGWGGRARVGVADGSFAAHLAARTTTWDPPDARARIVDPGGSPRFLAPQPVEVLSRPELAHLLRRLGLRALGDFAGLAPADVLARFGAEGLAAHRLARGIEEHPPATTEPPADLVVASDVDPPTDRVDVIAFVARTLAGDLESRLGALGMSCKCVSVFLETDHGETHERHWRHGSALSAPAVVDRVRWQVQGWVEGPLGARPTSGVCRLVLHPVEVVPARGRQMVLWGGEAAAGERVLRAVARIDGLLGPGSATVPELLGGRDPGEQVRMSPAALSLSDRDGEQRPPGRSDRGWRGRAPGHADDVDREPWPGRPPVPSPTWIHPEPVGAQLVDADGDVVTVSSRRAMAQAPARLSIGRGPWSDVEAWSLPWLAEQRWWDPVAARRRIRMQVLAGGQGHLLALESGLWWVEASYL